MEQTGTKMELMEFVQQITEALGPTWNAPQQPTGHGVTVVSDDSGARLHLTGNSWNWKDSDRIVVTGKYPRMNGKPVLSSREYTRITCAKKRGSEAVARDIERRFLPQYQKLVAQAQEKIEQREQENAEIRSQAEAFARIVDSDQIDGIGHHGSLREELRVNFAQGNARFGSHRVGITITLRLPASSAMRLAHFLKQEASVSR